MYTINPRVNDDRLELIKIFEQIETPTIGHFTDFGYARGIKYMSTEPVHIVGRALTVKVPHCDGSVIRQALLLSQPGDVIVIDTSGDLDRACWGSLRTITAMIKKVAAVVIDGAVTDINMIRKLGLPVFARSISPLTTRSLDMEGEINGIVSIGNVGVKPGDLVVADNNGVFVLEPKHALALSEKLLNKEDRDRQKILELYASYTPNSE